MRSSVSGQAPHAPTYAYICSTVRLLGGVSVKRVCKLMNS